MMCEKGFWDNCKSEDNLMDNGFNQRKDQTIEECKQDYFKQHGRTSDEDGIMFGYNE